MWLTDFVGWLPMSDGGEREAFLTTDYNAEMIEHIARFPRVRDRALYVGNADDIVPDAFGPDLPQIRDWTEEHYDLTGYVTGFDPAAFSDREALRAELGYAEDEQVCIVTVGGSGVGAHLLRRVIDAFPEAKERVPALRMIAVAGPRIDPATLPQEEGLEIRRYVHDLYRHLAACDLAVVQGGLTTSMELTANRRPFIYFPLDHHFEQNFHVRHRLERYGAGRRMDFATATPGTIAEAIADEIGREVDYRPVETDGAARAAALIAELLDVANETASRSFIHTRSRESDLPARPDRRHPDQCQLELADRVRAHHMVARVGGLPVAEPGILRQRVRRDGRRGRAPLLRFAPAARARARTASAERRRRDRRHQSLALRRRGAVQGQLSERRRRVPDRDRRPARLARR